MTQSVQNSVVSAVLVTDNAKRMEMLPKYFKGHYHVAESVIYSQMGYIADGYNGGFWEYYELSNGGFFMAPKGDHEYDFYIQSNGNAGRMSAEAAGITACLFAFSHMSFKPNTGHIADLYHLLKEYACEHVEARSILWACD